MRNRLGAAIVLAGLCAADAAAQEQIQWKQVANVAKGANLPAGVKWDLLGIELGETYATVRSKLDALLAEAQKQKGASSDPATARLLGQESSSPIEEQRMVIRLPLPSGGSIEASYPGNVILKREFKGAGPRTIGEEIRVRFSAPSSGHQVLAAHRFIQYYEHADQPRIGELVKSIAAKYGAVPRVKKHPGQTQVRLALDNGQVFVPANIVDENSCVASITESYDERDIRDMNRSGKCDVVLNVEINHGISDDHASTITFTMADYERIKANLTADYGFFNSYVNDLRGKTSGKAPKL